MAFTEEHKEKLRQSAIKNGEIVRVCKEYFSTRTQGERLAILKQLERVVKGR